MLTVVLSLCLITTTSVTAIAGILALMNLTQNAARTSPAAPEPAASELQKLIEKYLANSRLQSQLLSGSADRLWQIAADTPQLPLPLRDAIVEIRDAARVLSETLAAMNQLTSAERAAIRTSVPTSSAAPHAQARELTRNELVQLTPAAATAAEPAAEQTPLETPRYSFHCLQRAASWEPGQPLPSVADFQQVQCRDISAGGLSFLWLDRPTFEHLVVAIGTPEAPIYMAAQIVSSRAVYLFGSVGYLIDCKFTKRLDPSLIESGPTPAQSEHQRKNLLSDLHPDPASPCNLPSICS